MASAPDWVAPFGEAEYPDDNPGEVRQCPVVPAIGF